MANDLLADLLQRNIGMLNMHLSDFSEAEMFARPVPGANHAAWQLGHLASAEAGMINSVFPNAIPLPDGWKEKFTPETSKIDDPAKFASKEQLLATMSAVRAATLKWVQTLTPADRAKAIEGRMKDFVPTVDHMANMLAVHAAMHIGQFQVIRRKLGKPVLF
jgi:hypothetical protein